MRIIAQKIYGASDISLSEHAQSVVDKYEKLVSTLQLSLFLTQD